VAQRALWGRSDGAQSPGFCADVSNRESGVANNQPPIQANDLTSQSSGFIVKQRGIDCLANDSPSFNPVHPQIRAIGPRDLHLWEGRGREASTLLAEGVLELPLIQAA